MRGARSAWIVGGISTSASSAAASHRSPSRCEHAVLDEHAHQLAHEQRVALARRQHTARDRGRELVRRRARRPPTGWPRPRRARRARRRRRRRRATPATAAARAAPVGPRRRTSSGTSRAPLHDVLDQVEQERLRPVEVVEHQHDGAGAGQPGEQPPHRPERLLRRRRRARAEQAGGAVDDPVALGLVVGDERRDPLPDHVGRDGVADAGGGAERLRDRRERGEPAGVAPARRARWRGRDAPRRARRAGGSSRGRASPAPRDEPAPPVRDRASSAASSCSSSGARPTHGVVGCARDRRVERHQPVRRDQLGAALELQVAGGLERHGSRRPTAASGPRGGPRPGRRAPAGAPPRSPGRRRRRRRPRSRPPRRC